MFTSASKRTLVVARLAAALIVGASVAAAGAIVAPSAWAGTDDYPAKWKDKPRDSMFDTWGEYNRECTSWVAFRLHGHNHFEMPFHANANMWGSRAKALGYTVNTTPAVGSVAWWDTATRSHVAWVEAVNPDKTVTIEEYNIGGSGKYDEAIIPASNPTGYIHLQDLATSFTDGSYISYLGNVYRMAGGAPIYVSSWAAYGKKPVGLATSKQWLKLKKQPVDGTLLVGATSKKYYRVVGGAPVYLSSLAAVGASKTTAVSVPDASITNAGSPTFGGYAHLSFYPTGTPYVTTPTDKIYQLVNGAPVPVESWDAVGGEQPSITIGDDDIASAGSAPTTLFGHLKGYLAMPTPTVVGTAKIGKTLKVSLGTWPTTGVVLHYQWLRSGKVLPGATAATLTPKSVAHSAGKVFSVRVTASKVNYVDQTVTSTGTAPLAKK